MYMPPCVCIWWVSRYMPPCVYMVGISGICLPVYPGGRVNVSYVLPVCAGVRVNVSNVGMPRCVRG